MKRKLKFLCLLLSLVFALSIGVTACGGGGDDGSSEQQSSSSQNGGTSNPDSSSSSEDDEEGERDPGAGRTTVKFLFSGNDAEQTVFNNLVKSFNSGIGQTEGIYVSANYNSDTAAALGNVLGTDSCPDVFYVGDGNYKQYVEAGHLLDITSYVNASNKIDVDGTKPGVDDMWSSIRSRYFYNVETNRSGDEAGAGGKWYGLPKDIGPTVIFYNETMFADSGVTVISVSEEDLDDFNYESIPDDRGNYKSQYSIDGDILSKGYQIVKGKKVFNNQIAMSWEEVRELGSLIGTNRSAALGQTVYGYHTEWWFSYGWSVGGDCLQYVEDPTNPNYTGGYYDFTLVDDTDNFMVNVDGTTVGSTTYNAGEIVSYGDKLENEIYLTGKVDKHAEADYATIIDEDDGTLFTKLPSQREAFIEFVLLSTEKSVEINGKYGYEVCPSPAGMGGDGAKSQMFMDSQIAMLVDGRWNVTEFRKSLTFNWDVAPLPVYKTYDQDGNVVAKGLETGHSGSVSLSISVKTKVADAAWKFVEFLAGEDGQREQSLAGFAIPSQIELASDPNNGPNGGGVFVNQKDSSGNLLKPYNAKIFLRAAANEHEGDWAYTETGNQWINGWAGILNGPVRNGTKTFDEFVSDPVFLATWGQVKELTEKK